MADPVEIVVPVGVVSVGVPLMELGVEVVAVLGEDLVCLDFAFVVLAEVVVELLEDAGPLWLGALPAREVVVETLPACRW